MGKHPIPASLEEFVARQTTRSIADVWKGHAEEQPSPYGSWWYRAVACILLSGRVQAKHDGTPNMTDVNRFGKEANFNQYLTERVGKLLVAMGAIVSDRQDRYLEGPSLAAFWDHDTARLPAITQQAVLRLAAYRTDYSLWHPKPPADSFLIELLSLFVTAFRERALVESEVGQILHDFCLLPQDDLIEAADALGIAKGRVDVAGWQRRLDARGQKALIDGLYIAEWAYFAEHRKKGWLFFSPTGLAMLGLGPALAASELATEFAVEADLSISAGMGLSMKSLVPLFRHCKIKRIKEVSEFQLDRKRLAASPATTAPGDELKSALRELEPLPPPVLELLGTKSQVGGKISIRGCSALVKPENTEVLAAIRAHPKLKGYLEAGAPTGYLLIKEQSNPNNFVVRCRSLGFVVEIS